MNKIILIVAVLLIVLVAGYLLWSGNYGGNSSPTPSPTNAVQTNNVAIENFAFVPQVIKIKKGTTVTWTNKDSAVHKIASDPHPAHTDLPGLVSQTFGQNQIYSFTFDNTGTFGYHCHLHPYMKGQVVVEE